MKKTLLVVGMTTALVLVGCGKAKEDAAPAVVNYKDSVMTPVVQEDVVAEEAYNPFGYDATDEFAIVRAQFTTNDDMDHNLFHHKISITDDFVVMLEVSGDYDGGDVLVRNSDGVIFETELLGATSLDSGVRLLIAHVSGDDLLPGLNEFEIAVVDNNNNGTEATYTIYKNN